MKEWYDSSAEAGPQQRPRSETAIERPTLKVLAFDNGRLSIPPVVIDTHGSTGSSPLDAETKQIETWNAQHAPTNPQQGAGSGRAIACLYLLLGLWVLVKIVSVFCTFLPTIHSRIVGAATCKGHGGAVKVYIAKNGAMFLCNMSDSADVRIGPCELFGFNYGAFTEVLAGSF